MTDESTRGRPEADSDDWSYATARVDDEYADDEPEWWPDTQAAAAPGRGRRRRARGRGRLGKWTAPLLFLLPLLIVAALAYRWWQHQLDPPGEPGRVVTFVVKKDMSTRDIADALDDQGIIGSSFVFQMYARTGDRGPFQQGTFVMHEDEGVKSAAQILEGSGENPLEVGLLRGLRLEQAAKQLAAQIPGTDAKTFLEIARAGTVRSRYQPEGVDSLEGFLVPGTYTMPRGIDEVDALAAIVAQFDTMADRAGLSADAAGYDALVLASLVEKEATRDDERPLIAGVMRNRLAEGTRLQLDATVLYAVGRDGGFTTDEDRAVDSPYNTYRVEGLPPGPISNVTAPSLRAALKPKRSEFLFYVFKDCDGRHAFATTFEEHVRNTEAARDKGLFDGACS